jgi:hypothetical protein
MNEKGIIIESAETLYDDNMKVMVGQIGQSNNLTMARLMMNGLGGEYAPQAIIGSEQGLTLIIQFEGKDKRITITDVELETKSDDLTKAAEIFSENAINNTVSPSLPDEQGECAGEGTRSVFGIDCIVSSDLCTCGQPAGKDDELCPSCRNAEIERTHTEREEYDNEGKRPE